MKILAGMTIACSLAFATPHVAAQDAAAGKPAFDAGLAQKTGADDYGMRRYVLVILRTGPTRVVDAEERKAMFAGHMANIQRLSTEGKLALAGPFGKNDASWRGLFVFAVTGIDEARALVATDPVIASGEMVADYYPWYSSAAVTLVPELSETLVPPPPAVPATP